MWSMLLTTGLLLFGFLLAVSAQQYRISGRIPLDGEGGWDYLAVDSWNGQLYVSHGAEVVVVDLASQNPIAKITGMKRIHGIAVADDLNRATLAMAATMSL